MSTVRKITEKQYEILKLLKNGEFRMWCAAGFSSAVPHLFVRPVSGGSTIKLPGAVFRWLLNKNIVEIDSCKDEKFGRRKVPVYRTTEFLKTLHISSDMRI